MIEAIYLFLIIPLMFMAGVFVGVLIMNHNANKETDWLLNTFDIRYKDLRKKNENSI